MRLFRKFKKYAVICYVIHAKEVAYCETFKSFKKAKKSLDKQIAYDYECEKNYTDEMGIGYDVYLKKEDNHVLLERKTPDGTWIWTWDIIKCNEPSWTYWDALCERFYDFIDKFKKNDNT